MWVQERVLVRPWLFVLVVVGFSKWLLTYVFDHGQEAAPALQSAEEREPSAKACKSDKLCALRPLQLFFCKTHFFSSSLARSGQEPLSRADSMWENSGALCFS